VIPPWPGTGAAVGSALIRCIPEDFRVSEELGFDLSGDGEHCFLYLQKRELNTLELVQRLSGLAGVPARDIGFSGLKDRNAVTGQWFSIRLAGRPEPDWRELEAPGDVQVQVVGRHRRKLKRGVHRANRFTLVLRQLEGGRAALESRLEQLRASGAPNYFGEQRFGRNGATLEQAQRWMRGRRRISREKRSLYLSALRAYVFNTLLAQRVQDGDWHSIRRGDVCLLHGTRSFFTCEDVDDDIRSRADRGDLHPGLPLWGEGDAVAGLKRDPRLAAGLSRCQPVCDFLEASGTALAWRPTRVLPDDFYWQFCDDGTLQLDFALGAGSYATALLAEFVHYKEKGQKGMTERGRGCERD